METTTIRDGVNAVPREASSAVASRAVTVCLIGQPYWAKKLEANLNDFGESRLRAFYFPLKPMRFLQSLRKAITADLIVSVGYRPGARTVRGRVFDAFWGTLRLLNRRGAGLFYWIGTDVLNTTEDLRAGELSRGPFERAKRDYHLADAPWLVEELGKMGITALPKTLTLPPIAGDSAPELPVEFSVLTYIPDFRYRFYGGEAIYEAARRLPDVRFDVVAGLGAWIPEPLPNLIFHGWQSDMQRFYRNTSVLVRIVEHDGIGLTAVEALSLGRHVIYSLPLPHTLLAAWGDSETLIDKLSELFRLHQRGSLHVNAAGRAYVEENFDHHRCMEDLMSYFLEIAAGRQDRKEEKR